MWDESGPHPGREARQALKDSKQTSSIKNKWTVWSAGFDTKLAARVTALNTSFHAYRDTPSN